jgi:uncharacterized membrane protein
MAKDIGDAIGTVLGHAAREAAESLSESLSNNGRKGSAPLSGMRGVAAGAGLVTLVPLAGKAATKLFRGADGAGPVKKIGGKIGEGAKDAVGKSVEEAGGAAGVAKEAGKGLLPGGGKGKQGDAPGTGKGRRMPIQQAVDVAVPLRTAYNQWTQFEEWPKFMHRLQGVSQEDECHVSFKTKIWGISKEFNAEILEQRPDERIKWRVTEGITHTGVVTFHELSDRLTRIELTLDVDPGSLIEKAARGMRHVKRAVRADLHRFKAYIEMEEEETGAWRGVIEDAEVKSSPGSGKSSGSRGGRKSSSSGGRKSSSSAARKSSSSARSSSSSGSRSRKSSSRSSSNGSRASSNGRRKSSSSRKKSGSRS